VGCAAVAPTGVSADTALASGPGLESSQEKAFPGILLANMARPAVTGTGEAQAGPAVSGTSEAQVPGSSPGQLSRTRAGSKRQSVAGRSATDTGSPQDSSALNTNLQAVVLVTAAAITSRGGAPPASQEPATSMSTAARGGVAAVAPSSTAGTNGAAAGLASMKAAALGAGTLLTGGSNGTTSGKGQASQVSGPSQALGGTNWAAEPPAPKAGPASEQRPVASGPAGSLTAAVQAGSQGLATANGGARRQTQTALDAPAAGTTAGPAGATGTPRQTAGPNERGSAAQAVASRPGPVALADAGDTGAPAAGRAASSGQAATATGLPPAVASSRLETTGTTLNGNVSNAPKAQVEVAEGASASQQPGSQGGEPDRGGQQLERGQTVAAVPDVVAQPSFAGAARQAEAKTGSATTQAESKTANAATQATGITGGSVTTDGGAAAAGSAVAAHLAAAGPTAALGGTTAVSQNPVTAGQPDGAQALGHMVTARLVQAANSGESRLVLNLHPPELGSLQAELALSGGKLNLSLGTSTLQAQHAVQQALPELQQSLQEKGIVLGQCNVSLTSDGGQSGQQGSGSGSPGLLPADAVPAGDEVQPQLATRAEGLIAGERIDLLA